MVEQQQALMVESSLRICASARNWLHAAGWEGECAHTIAEATERLAERPYGLVLFDLELPDGRGLKLLPAVQKFNPSAETVIVVPDNALAEAVEALRLGVVDFVQHPVTHEDFISMLRRVTVRRSLREGRVEQKVNHIAAMITMIVDRLGSVERELAALHRKFEGKGL